MGARNWIGSSALTGRRCSHGGCPLRSPRLSQLLEARAPFDAGPFACQYRLLRFVRRIANTTGHLPASPTPPTRSSSLKLRLGLFQGRHAVRSRHRTVDGHGPEPAQTVGAAAGLIDAADLPAAAEDGQVRAVLVDPGARPVGRSLRGITRSPPAIAPILDQISLYRPSPA
jgi:hypothetical protein